MNNLLMNSSIYSDPPTGRLALVFEIMEMNVYECIKGKAIGSIVEHKFSKFVFSYFLLCR